MRQPESGFPAPLWRRLAAAVYDSLLLLGLWMSALLIEEVLRALLGFGHSWIALRAYLFAVGLLFFGWSWTRGGQTLGMRAWRLRLESETGIGLRWPAAIARYAVMLGCWGVSLAPLLARLPQVRTEALAQPVSLACGLLLLLGLLVWRLDPQRRGPQDWIAGSRVISLPKSA